MRDPGQLGIQLGQLQERTLLCYFGFHDSLPSIVSAKVPRVGAQGSVRVRTRAPAAAAEAGPQHLGGLFAPGEFAGPVCDVDQRHLRGPAMLVGRMVAQIGRQIGLHVRAGRGAQQRVTGAATDRDPRHRHVGIAGGAHPPGRLRQRGANAGDEGAQRFGLGQRADAAQPGVARAGVPGRRCRTRALRRDARRASPTAQSARIRAGATTSTRSSSTRSTVPTLPTAGVAPSCGRNCPMPLTLQLQCE